MRVFADSTCVMLILSAMVISLEEKREFSDCGGTITNLVGQIRNYVGPKTFCTWTIKINSSQQIALMIPSLELSCNNEKLEILDGGPPDTVSLGKLCRGYHLTFRSSTNIMTIQYSRNSSHAPSSFYIFYYGDERATERVDNVKRVHSDCGGIITDTGGKIINFLGPKTPCVWTIKMKPSYSISVIIPLLNLTCQKETLEIIDGSEGDGSFGKICEGSDISYQSSTNILTIKYFRISKHQPTYFSVYFYAIPEGVSDVSRPIKDDSECGSLLTKPFGTIFNSKLYNPECIWIINLDLGEQVVLKFYHVDLVCAHEHLEILDGPPGSNLLGKICYGYFLIYKSTLNVMTVKYVTNSSQRSSRFAMNYYGVPGKSRTLPIKTREPGDCDDLATDPLSWFNSKGDDMSCIWTLLIKPTYQGLLAFPFLSFSCETDTAGFVKSNFQADTYGRVCPSMSFTYKTLSDHMVLSYYKNSIHEPKLFDAYLYSDTEKTIESPKKKRGSGDCGSHLAHSSGKYLGSFGPRISCVWKIQWKSSGDITANPIPRFSCASEETEGSFGNLGWDYFWKICEGLSFSYKPFSGHVKLSHFENSTGPAISSDAFFYDFSKGKFSATICLPPR